MTFTFSIPSAEWERSFHAMDRLRTWLRQKMKRERLDLGAITDIIGKMKWDTSMLQKSFFNSNQEILA